ncbi:Cyclin-dependent kinase C-2 [Spatholobus suberectus]|nr:Cyclin-dependent kinase C-2 [Spatholobus suberectus]
MAMGATGRLKVNESPSWGIKKRRLLREVGANPRGHTWPEQLNKIFELCGAPDEVNWPGVSKTPWYSQFEPTRPMKRCLREVFRHFDRHALELLEKMLTLDPALVLL